MGIEIINMGYDAQAKCGECGREVVVREIEDDDEDYVAELLECEFDWVMAKDGTCFCETCKEKPDVIKWMSGCSRLNRRLFDLTSDGRMVLQ